MLMGRLLELLETRWCILSLNCHEQIYCIVGYCYSYSTGTTVEIEPQDYQTRL